MSFHFASSHDQRLELVLEPQVISIGPMVIKAQLRYHLSFCVTAFAPELLLGSPELRILMFHIPTGEEYRSGSIEILSAGTMAICSVSDQ